MCRWEVERAASQSSIPARVSMQAEETQKSTSFSEISLNFLIAQTLVSSYAHLTKAFRMKDACMIVSITWDFGYSLIIFHWSDPGLVPNTDPGLIPSTPIQTQRRNHLAKNLCTYASRISATLVGIPRSRIHLRLHRHDPPHRTLTPILRRPRPFDRRPVGRGWGFVGGRGWGFVGGWIKGAGEGGPVGGSFGG